MLISALALFVLLLPRPRYLKIVALLLYTAACVGVAKNEKVTWRFRHPIVALLSCGALAHAFYFRWINYKLIGLLSNLTGCSAHAIVLLLCVVGSVLSLPMMDAVISLLLRRDQGSSGASMDGRRGLTAQEILICAAIALLAAFQFFTNPFSAVHPSPDSSAFLYIGRRMHDGLMPYRDIFDHKGPVLYILNWLGMFIHTERAPYLGVWLIECINMFAFACAVLQLLDATCLQKRAARYIIVAVICIRCIQSVIIGGNLSEEYALPWIAIALRIFLDYFRTRNYRFRDIVLLGFGLGFVLLLRPNMIGIWALLTPVVLASLLQRRRFADVGRCALGYAAGLAAVLVPVLVWLGVTHCLSAMVECYIKFNFVYSGSDLTPLNGITSMMSQLAVVPFLLPALAITLPLLRRDSALRINFLVILGTLVLSSVSGRSYQHYALPLLPLLALPLAALFSIGTEVKLGAHALMWKRLACAALALCMLLQGVRTASLSPSGYRVGQEAAYLRENTSSEDDVLVVGIACSVYLQADRCTRNRFVYQPPLIYASDAIYEEFLNELEVHPSDVILVSGGGNRNEDLTKDDSMTRVYQHLDDMYRAGKLTLEEYDTFYVYRRVEA